MNIGVSFALAAAITWGLVYAIDQKILVDTPPLTLLFIDSAISAVVLLPLLFMDRAAIKVVLMSGKMNLTLIVLSLLLAIAANYFIFSGIKLIGASSASLIEIGYPLFVVLFSVVLYHTSASFPVLIGGILIFAGSGIITYFH